MTFDRRILVVDDEENLRHLLTVILKRAGYTPVTAANGNAALRIMKNKPVRVVLSDMRMPGMDGLTLLERLRALEAPPYVVMMSAYGDAASAIDAIKRGAYDFVSKPFKADEIVFALTKIEERERLSSENRQLREELSRRNGLSDIIGRSAAMERILSQVERIARFNTNVLITGESGTGKELLARALHSGSPRAGATLVPVNCGAIPEALLESELFGHARGAFTGATASRQGLFEEASGGTLFLDEIAELPVQLQVKLLRVLEEGRLRRVGDNALRDVDVRLVAATSRDLEAMVRDGSFREDLYYRLNVMHLHLPPLRERPEDIPLLAQHFLRLLNLKLGTAVESFTDDAFELLVSHGWPGNVRELRNVVERSIVMSDGTAIREADLPSALSNPRARNRAPAARGPGGFSIKRQVKELERRLIVGALEQTGGNRTHAAQLLEISHRSLLYKIKDYAIEIPAGGA